MDFINADRNWINRDNAVTLAGEKLIAKAEAENCENSNIITDGTEYTGYDIYEVVAENGTHRVTVIFLQDAEETKYVTPNEMDWNIEAYKIEEV